MHDIGEVIDIFTSEDMENISPESWMCFHMNITEQKVYLPEKHSCLYNKNPISPNDTLN